MPNLMTHKIFANDVLKVSSSKILDYVSKNPQAFSVGSSGPDFLFYYGQIPGQDKEVAKRVVNIGSLIHAYNINDWHKVAIESIISEKDEKLKATMISFFIGHITHWALDAKTHPFIFYRSDGSSEESKYWHYRYESMLDTVMVNEYKKTSIKAYPSKEILKTDKHIRAAIYQVYKDAVEKVFEIDFKKDYVDQSFKDCDKALNFLYDPSGIKFKLIKFFETLINKKWQYSSHIVFDKVDKDADVLNLNNHQWKNPAKPSFVSNESFLDLYYKAIDLSLKALNEFVLVLEGKPIDDFLKVINNRSYETGLSYHAEMVEYKSIY